MLMCEPMVLSLHSIMFLLIRFFSLSIRFFTSNFTFHNVSINTKSVSHQRYKNSNFTFHNVSINTDANGDITPFYAALHSIMFLLILIAATFSARFIKSLHSIMFLLILDNLTKQMTGANFTFHNVSINTDLHNFPGDCKTPLHSIMFLLIRFSYA